MNHSKSIPRDTVLHEEAEMKEYSLRETRVSAKCGRMFLGIAEDLEGPEMSSDSYVAFDHRDTNY